MIELTAADRLSPVWKKVEAHCQERIVALRFKNDSSLPEGATSFLRGEIHALKSLVGPETVE